MLNTVETARIADEVRARVMASELDLAGAVVITEAATGAYAATSAAAAYAGAEVHAFATPTVHGSVEDASVDVHRLAGELGVADEIAIVTSREALPFDRAHIVTNSGVVRPIDAAVIALLPPTARIALMYEAWEARAGDVDYAAAADRGIPVVGVDEHHPACGAFDFVGDLVLAAIRHRGWPVPATVALVSDNPFADPVRSALERAGVHVTVVDGRSTESPVEAECVVVAATPEAVTSPIHPQTMSRSQIGRIVAASGASKCVQLWGDVDRSLGPLEGVQFEPIEEPRPGHQGISMTAAGPEPVVRLQVGGLAAVVHLDAPPGSWLAGLAQVVGAAAPKGT